MFSFMFPYIFALWYISGASWRAQVPNIQAKGPLLDGFVKREALTRRQYDDAANRDWPLQDGILWGLSSWSMRMEADTTIFPTRPRRSHVWPYRLIGRRAEMFVYYTLRVAERRLQMRLLRRMSSDVYFSWGIFWSQKSVKVDSINTFVATNPMSKIPCYKHIWYNEKQTTRFSEAIYEVEPSTVIFSFVTLCTIIEISW